MEWEKKYLDMILVPSGLMIMLGYHLFLLYRIIKLPHTTVIGYENHNKRAWVQRMMNQVGPIDTGLALQVISSNIGAATFLATLSIALSSLIGTWVGSTSHNLFISDLVYGDMSSTTVIIKYISILSFFLIAFASFIQSSRHFVHANFLLTTPSTDIPVKYVEKAVIRGSNFWSLGLRAIYFAITLLLWIFGPIPMFVSSVIMVVLLHFLDINSCPLHAYGPPNESQLTEVKWGNNNSGGEITTITKIVEQRATPVEKAE